MAFSGVNPTMPVDVHSIALNSDTATGVTTTQQAGDALWPCVMQANGYTAQYAVPTGGYGITSDSG